MFKVRSTSLYFVATAILALSLSACKGTGPASESELSALCSKAGTGRYHAGEGSESTPYLICTAEQFYNIGRNPSDWSRHFVQGQDIDLGAYNGSTSAKTLQPIGSYTASGNSNIPFTGTYNGVNFKLKNYTHSNALATNTSSGLFGYIDGSANIKNLIAQNAQVSAPNQEYVAVFAGVMEGGTIENCHITSGQIGAKGWMGGFVGHMRGGSILQSSASVDITATHYYAGGIAGFISAGSIQESFSSSAVSALAYAGSLAGYMSSNASVTDSYATGDVTAGTNSGGLVGLSLGTIRRSYSTGKVTASSGQDHAGLVGFALSGIIEDSYSTSEVNGLSFAGGLVGLKGSPVITNSYFTDDDLGQGGTQALNNPAGARRPATSTWNFNTVWSRNNLRADPILKWQSDFYCNSKTEELSPFAGGDGSVISPYVICTPAQLNAIGSSDSYLSKDFAVFANINLSAYDGTTAAKTFNSIGSYDSASGRQVPFTGSFDGHGYTISHYTHPSSGNATSAAGFFGHTSGAKLRNIILSQVTIRASSQSRVGGLVGYANGGTQISGCSTGSGQILDADIYVGGLVGQIGRTKIYDSSSAISFAGSTAGGLVGYMDNNSLIERSFATGSVTGAYNVGGLVGLIGNASGTNSNTIRHSYATGSVSGANNIGGLVGFFYGQIYDSFASGDVTGTDSVGGLTGWGISCTANSTFSLGDISGTSMVGGNIGRHIACSLSNNHFVDDTDNGNGTQHWSMDIDQDALSARQSATANWDSSVWSGLNDNTQNPRLAWE